MHNPTRSRDGFLVHLVYCQLRRELQPSLILRATSVTTSLSYFSTWTPGNGSYASQHLTSHPLFLPLRQALLGFLWGFFFAILLLDYIIFSVWQVESCFDSKPFPIVVFHLNSLHLTSHTHDSQNHPTCHALGPHFSQVNILSSRKWIRWKNTFIDKYLLDPEGKIDIQLSLCDGYKNLYEYIYKHKNMHI